MRVWELAEELHVLSADILEAIKPHDAYVTSHLAAVPRQALDAIRATPPPPKWHPGEYYEWHRQPPRDALANVSPPGTTVPRARRRTYRRRPGPKIISFEPPYEEDTNGYGNDTVAELLYEPTWSTRDVARYFGVQPATVRQWVKRGHLRPSGTAGPSNVFERDDVIAAAEAITRRRKPAGRPNSQPPAAAERPALDLPPSALRTRPHSHGPNAHDIYHAGLGTKALHRLAAVTPDAIVTTTEAATMLGLAPATIRSWVSRGHLQPIPTSTSQTAHHRFFRLADLYSASRRP